MDRIGKSIPHSVWIRRPAESGVRFGVVTVAGLCEGGLAEAGYSGRDRNGAIALLMRQATDRAGRAFEICCIAGTDGLVVHVDNHWPHATPGPLPLAELEQFIRSHF
jgi:hypothetical protein